MADLTPEEIERVRREGRRRRKLSRKEQRRVALAPIVDTGNLSDDDVQVLYDAFVDGLAPDPNESR